MEKPTRHRLAADAGADAILIHLKAPTAAEATEFARRWSRDTPLVVVPTTCSTLLWRWKRPIQGGHLRQSPVRAAITAMKV
jgi:2-methylisocitrate lyase-like PEP mutase family enzyme